MSVEISNGVRCSAVLFDFGEVMPSSGIDPFGDFGGRVCVDRRLPMRLFGGDPESERLLVEHETGLMAHGEFEAGFAARLSAHGAEVEVAGLTAAMQSCH